MSPKRRTKRVLRWIFLGALSALYASKPDAAAALTIFPAFIWLPLFLLIGLRRPWKSSRTFLLAVGLFAFVFCEEIPSLARGVLPAKAAPNSIRVVSLNCAGGSVAAAKEVAALKPDIVLLQESPGSDELEGLKDQLFGSRGTLIAGPDGSILTRFAPVDDIRVRAMNHTAATFEVSGRRVEIMSLRLAPPAFRVDLFDPDAWQAVAENRRQRREELRDLFAGVQEHSLIAGGDFNCQSGDTSLSSMPTWLRDVFYEVGTGWGHTCVNDYPLARIDKVWISPDWRGVRQWVQPTKNSDHRMVITDVLMR